MLKHRALFLGLMAVLVAGFALGSEAIPNWAAPATWSPPRSAGVHTMGDVTIPLPFIGVTPCRIWDTRGNGFGGQYGPPIIAANTQRTFTIAGQCGIPASAAAVSFNIGALDVGAAGDLRVFPAGGAVPLVSTMNYNANTPNIANAAVVPLGTGSAITLQADGTAINSIGDVNGYYASIPATLTSPFVVENQGAFAIVGANASTGAGVAGVFGVINTTAAGGSSAGVLGVNDGTAGAVFGVRGVTDTSNSCAAAVYGQAGAAMPCLFGGTGGPAVWGTSFTDWAILGLSANNRGVQGSRTDTAGAFLTSGVLGFSGTIGVFSFDDYGGVGAKYFIEPHPMDATKQIGYISLEGPEAGTYFRGRGRFVSGQAVIPVPEDFRLVTEEKGLTVQITPIGRVAQVGVVSMDLDNIVAEGSRDVEFSYLVQGVRKGYADMKPIQENTVFIPDGPNDRMGPYPERIRQRLVSLGIYNQDGTVNMETARRLGWDKAWEANAEQAKAAAAKRAAAKGAGQQ